MKYKVGQMAKIIEGRDKGDIVKIMGFRITYNGDTLYDVCFFDKRDSFFDHELQIYTYPIRISEFIIGPLIIKNTKLSRKIYKSYKILNGKWLELYE